MIEPARLRGSLTLALALGLSTTFALASCSEPGSAPTVLSSPTFSTTASPSMSPSATASPTSQSAAPTASAGTRIEISVKGKQVTPAPGTVNIAVGESLTIAITSDRDNTLHAHGFDIARDVKAGEQVSVTIKGARSGVFEFELHDPALKLFQVAVR